MIVPKECNSTQSNPYMDAETTYKFYNESMLHMKSQEKIKYFILLDELF